MNFSTNHPDPALNEDVGMTNILMKELDKEVKRARIVIYVGTIISLIFVLSALDYRTHYIGIFIGCNIFFISLFFTVIKFYTMEGRIKLECGHCRQYANYERYGPMDYFVCRECGVYGCGRDRTSNKQP